MLKKYIQLLILISLFSAVNFASALEVTRIEQNGNRLILHLRNDIIEYIICSDHILKANYQSNGFKDDPTLVIWKNEWQETVGMIDTTGDPIRLSAANFTAEINRTPFTFRLINRAGKTLISQYELDDFPEKEISFTIEKGNIYGIINNQQGTLTKNNGGEIAAGSQGEAGAPFLWSTKGWGFLCDSNGGKFSLGENLLTLKNTQNFEKRDFDIYFTIGTPPEIFTAMTDITGKPPLFPKFDLGFLNTEWKLDEKELLSDIRKYREKDIPIDAYILDFDWMAYGEDNYGEFRWGPKFPGALTGELQNTLDSLKLKLFGIRKPRIHLNTIQGNYCVANNFFIDVQTDYFTRKMVGRLNFLDSRVREWYWQSFAIQEETYDKGIIGYWNDEADEYGGNFMFMQMQRAQYEGQRQYNNKRVWSINRNFYLGAQRYAYAHWSGDIGTGFQSMAAQRTFMLSSINLGSCWWSMDTGGFHGTPSPENYIRWIQFATFVPIMRVHGTFGEEREPWNYGPTAERISRKYIKLRYALIPYIYSYAWQNHKTGVSIVRPFCFVCPDNPEFANETDQWYFGEELLVHPVVEPGAKSVSVFVPQGEWYDFHNGNMYSGPASINYPVTMEDIPILVKAGAIIPMQPVGAVVDDPDTSTKLLHIVCYPGSDGQFTLYEDDGETYDYEQGVFCQTKIESFDTEDKFYLVLNARSGPYQPPKRDVFVEVKWLEAEPEQVALNNEIIKKKTEDGIRDSSVTAWAFSKNIRSAFIRFPDNGIKRDIQIFTNSDSEPPDIDSVKCTTDTTLIVYFSEKVLSGDDSHSAENLNNYEINNDIIINRIKLSFDQSAATLSTSLHQTGKSYLIEISNIADLSPAKNIMSRTAFEYECEIETSQYYIIQEGLNGYTGTSDAHIAENFPDHNMGGYHQFEACRYAGDNENDDKSMLIKFELSTLSAPRESILKVELILTLVDTRFGEAGKYVACHRLLKDWNEGEDLTGIDGSAAQPGWVTWQSAKHHQELWENPGGDFFNFAEDEVFVEGNINQEYSWDVTDLFHFWINSPDSNFGVILRERMPSYSHGTKVFASSEHEILQFRPKLKLEGIMLAMDDRENQLFPKTFALLQNYPNPFNNCCTIRFELPDPAIVKLSIFNIRGQKVAEIINDRYFDAGRYNKTWDGLDSNGGSVSSGLYFYTFSANQFHETKKMLMIR